MFEPTDKYVTKEDVCWELDNIRKRSIALAVMTLFLFTEWYLWGKWISRSAPPSMWTVFSTSYHTATPNPNCRGCHGLLTQWGSIKVRTVFQMAVWSLLSKNICLSCFVLKFNIFSK
jgi:hypothetical protein